MKRLLWLYASCLLGCSGSEVAKKEEPAAEQIAKEFTSYGKMSPHPIEVNPELAMLCVGVSQKRLEAVKEKHGPHANTSITVYMNDLAQKAFATSAVPYPVGAVVVKQKTGGRYWGDDSHKRVQMPNGVGGMIKRAAGYDPENGDWEYFYFEQRHAVESGRIPSCIQCHERARNKDYVFGSWQITNATPGR